MAHLLILSCSSSSTNLIIMLGMMQVTKRIPFDDPNVLNIVRLVYVSSNIIICGIYLYVQSQINKKKGSYLQLPRAHRAHPY